MLFARHHPHERRDKERHTLQIHLILVVAVLVLQEGPIREKELEVGDQPEQEEQVGAERLGEQVGRVPEIRHLLLDLEAQVVEDRDDV